MYSRDQMQFNEPRWRNWLKQPYHAIICCQSQLYKIKYFSVSEPRTYGFGARNLRFQGLGLMVSEPRTYRLGASNVWFRSIELTVQSQVLTVSKLRTQMYDLRRQVQELGVQVSELETYSFRVWSLLFRIQELTVSELAAYGFTAKKLRLRS